MNSNLSTRSEENRQLCSDRNRVGESQYIFPKSKGCLIRTIIQLGFGIKILFFLKEPLFLPLRGVNRALAGPRGFWVFRFRFAPQKRRRHKGFSHPFEGAAFCSEGRKEGKKGDRDYYFLNCKECHIFVKWWLHRGRLNPGSWVQRLEDIFPPRSSGEGGGEGWTKENTSRRNPPNWM